MRSSGQYLRCQCHDLRGVRGRRRLKMQPAWLWTAKERVSPPKDATERKSLRDTGVSGGSEPRPRSKRQEKAAYACAALSVSPLCLSSDQ